MAQMTPAELARFNAALRAQQANDRKEGRVPTEALKGSTSGTPSSYTNGVTVTVGPLGKR